jgi:DNA-binding transcriptional ArsR family regulator
LLLGQEILSVMRKTATRTKSVLSVDTSEALQALSHPTRVAILESLREPGSAAEVARTLGQPRQRVNYHLKELEKAGLVRRTGTRTKRNLVEVLYRSVARSFVVSPKVAWSHPDRVAALRRQHSLEALVDLGERLQRDAAALLDRAAFEGEDIPSAAATAEVGFADEDARAAFMDDYLRSTKELLDRHGAGKGGQRFRAILAVYPEGAR